MKILQAILVSTTMWGMIHAFIRRLLHKFHTFSPGESLYLKLSKSFHFFPTFTSDSAIEAQIQRDVNLGLMNQSHIPSHANRLWPWWIKRISNPSSRFYSLTPQPSLLLNTLFRQSTPLFSIHDGYISTVDPYGSLSPHPRHWSIEFWVDINGKKVAFQDIETVHQQFSPDSLQVQTTLSHEGVEISSTSFLKSYPKKDHLIFSKLSFKNTTESPVSLTAYVCIRPYNMEGISPISELTYLSKRAFVVNNQLGLILDQKPDNVVCARFDDGDAFNNSDNWQMMLSANCPKHMATGFAEFSLKLQTQESKDLSFKVPLTKKRYKLFKPDKLMATIQDFQGISYENEETHVAYEWKQRHNSTAMIQLPNSRINHLVKQSLAFVQLSLPYSNPADRVAHTPLSALYLRLRTLLAFGYTEEVGNLLKSILDRKTYSKGSPPWGYPSVASLISLLYYYQRVNPDREMLAHAEPHITNCIGILKRHITGKHKDYHLSGLMSPTVGGSGEKDYYMPDQLMALGAFHHASVLYRSLGLEEQSHHCSAQYNHLKSSIETFAETISDKYTQTFITPYSSTHFEDARIIEGLSYAFPLKLPNFKPDWLKSTLSKVYESHTLANQPFDQTRNGYHTRYIAQLAHLTLNTDPKKTFDHLDWLTSHASNTGLWPTTIHPFSNSGSTGVGYDLETSSSYLLLVKSLIIQETRDDIHFFPCMPTEWIKDDQPIIIENLPTRKGHVSIKLSFKGNQAKVVIDFKLTAPPKKFKLSLPYTIEKVTVGKSVTEPHATTISIALNAKDLQLQLKREKHETPTKRND